MPTSGTFVATHADDGGAVLRDAETGQVFTLVAGADVEAGAALRATVESGPLGVAYHLVEVRERWTPSVTVTDDAPSVAAREAAADREAGDLAVLDREASELHVLPVEGDERSAAEEVAADPATRDRAARLGAREVVVRAGDGLVSVRYR